MVAGDEEGAEDVRLLLEALHLLREIEQETALNRVLCCFEVSNMHERERDREITQKTMQGKLLDKK